MGNIVFEAHVFEQFNTWAIGEQKIYANIVKLIDDIQRPPFEGLGKPEPLKHHLNSEYRSLQLEEDNF
jgi:toxin YoeB